MAPIKSPLSCRLCPCWLSDRASSTGSPEASAASTVTEVWHAKQGGCGCDVPGSCDVSSCADATSEEAAVACASASEAPGSREERACDIQCKRKLHRALQRKFGTGP
eukprot:scaffold73318_cov75-Phaeocystis_antarctica.AAC.3